MDTIVIMIKCELCNKLQEYHAQYKCDNCQKPFSPWSVASQLLKLQKEKK